jgi:hypothetical protein
MLHKDVRADLMRGNHLALSDVPSMTRVSQQPMAVDNTTAGLQSIASITFGCLAAACFVDGKLSRFQAALATVQCARV